VCLFCMGAIGRAMPRPCFGMERKKEDGGEDGKRLLGHVMPSCSLDLQLSAYYCVPATIRQAGKPFLQP